MPRSINGCGTMYCGHSAAVYWENPGPIRRIPAEHDAIVCVTLFMLPLIPLRPVHVYDHTGNVCRELPLRWSRHLVLRAFLRPLLFAVAGFGTFLSVIFILGLVIPLLEKSPIHFESVIWLGIMALSGLVIGYGGTIWLNLKDRRSRDIRLVLGRHELGSSDPALWTTELLQRNGLQSGAEVLKTAATAFKEGQLSSAMFSARCAVAGGNILEGEALTDQILADLRIAPVLPQLRKSPWRRSELLQDEKSSQNESQPSPVTYQCAVTGEALTPETGVLFYDGRYYAKRLVDEIGGEGFSAFVGQNPVLTQPAPAPFFVRFILLASAILFLAFVVSGLCDAHEKEKMDLILGGLIIVGLFGWGFFSSTKKRVTIGYGRLVVGVPKFKNASMVHGEGTLVDAITSIRRRRYAAVVPCVAAAHIGGEISWMRPKKQADDIERVLQVCLELRKRHRCVQDNVLSNQTANLV